MAAITATYADYEHVGSKKVLWLTFTSSGTNAANVSDTITIPFKKVRHVIGIQSALVDSGWSFAESTGVLTLTVEGGNIISVEIVGY
jgi:hypothetical protein